MTKIFKYPLGHTTVQSVMLPKGAEILSIQLTEHGVAFWAEVEPLNEQVKVTIHMVYTGEEVPPQTLYIGTVVQGEWVLHFYRGIR